MKHQFTKEQCAKGARAEGRIRRKFTKEQCSRGGINARDIELAQGKKLNHGILWGKKKSDNQRDI